MLKIILIGFLFSLNSFAKDQWICTEESGELKDNVYHACGIGEHPSEAKARSEAMAYAKAEFNSFCKDSYNCHGHRINIEPKRTTCSQEKGMFKCYRMMEFTILDSTLSSSEIEAKQASSD